MTAEVAQGSFGFVQVRSLGRAKIGVERMLRVTERSGWDEDIVKNLNMITTISDDNCYL